MPFGLCNAGATFSRLMESVLKGLTWRTCLAYLDDIIVYGRNWSEHTERLREVFDRIRKAGLKLKARKCELAAKEVDFLGHKVSEDGIYPNKDKTKAIQLIKQPKTVKEVRSFLGIASYYRRFIRNFAKTADPLYEILAKSAKFNWTPKCQQAFESLKTSLINPPIMAYPNYDQTFKVYTDASNIGMGAVLMQLQGSKERVIAYASKSLSKSERNYSATKKEALALVWALRHFRPYLYKPFKVYTDHYALKWLRQMKGGAALLHRWCLELEEYQFEVIHKPGLQQGHADGLSRLPLETKDEDEEENHIWFISVQDEKETKKLLKDLHNDPSAGGHLGSRILLKKFNERYKSQYARKLSETVVKECEACQRHTDYTSHELAQKVNGEMKPACPWDILALDLVGPLPDCNGYRFILTVIDTYSRYLFLIPMRQHTATEVAEKLIAQVFMPFGLCNNLISDRAPEFMGDVWKEVLEYLNIEQWATSPYYPQGNGRCERSHRTLMKMIKAKMEQNKNRNWVDLVAPTMLAYNTANHSESSVTPFELIFGRKGKTLFDITNNTEIDKRKFMPQTDYAKKLKNRMERTRK
jgi:transposase InsO family protein